MKGIVACTVHMHKHVLALLIFVLHVMLDIIHVDNLFEGGKIPEKTVSYALFGTTNLSNFPVAA